MNYLERNELILKEVAKHLQTRELLNNSQIAEMKWRFFVPIGSLYSHVLQSALFVGLKDEGSSSFQRAEEELAIISIVSHNLPHLIPELPQFYGLITDSRGYDIGLVMEDFSQGGKYLVTDYYHVLKGTKGNEGKKLPYEINDLLKGTGRTDLDHLSFLVDGQRKLGDFDKTFSKIENIEKAVRQLGIGVSYQQFLQYLRWTPLSIH